MKLLRSFPATVPQGRAHVVDGVERFVMSGYDYAGLEDVGDDIVMLEWDIAVGEEELDLFVSLAMAEPDRVIAAPYRMYTSTGTGSSIRKAMERVGHPVWVMRREVGNGPGFRQVERTDTHCHYFGLGLTYLPNAMIQAFIRDKAKDTRSVPWGFNDGSFSAWHWRVVKEEVPIIWDATVSHLNYEVDRIERKVSRYERPVNA